MNTYAHIANGRVVETTTFDGLITDLFPEAMDWVDVTGVTPSPEANWTTADGGKTFAPPVVTHPIDLVAYANMKQWELATGGFTATVAGQALTFSTSEVSLALINGKFLRLAQPSPPATFNWQFPTGFVSIAAADFIKVATAISDFVQATFDALPAVFSAIAAGTITTTAQVDAAAWPSAVASS